MNELLRNLTNRLWAFLLAGLLLAGGGPLLAQKAKGGGAPAKRATITNSLGMSFVKIPAGSFMMGTASKTHYGECPDCNGSGKREVARTRQESSESQCSSCAGRGDVICDGYFGWPHTENWSGSYRIPCSKCNGTGRKKCYSCGGSGRGGSSSRTVTEGYDIRLCTACKGKGKRMIDTGGGDSDEKPAHKVRISEAFYLQTTEVTQGQWKAVMGTTPWAGKDDVKEGDDYPAVYVSWDDAKEFQYMLNTKGQGSYRLPTEAEWEYACRAGTSTKYSFGDDEGRLGDYAWFTKNADDIGDKFAHRVAAKRPNPWGLFDMHGNVWEWCQDWKGEYGSGAQTDPTGPSSGSIRVYRGGSWLILASDCRSADRDNGSPDCRGSNLGFRLLRTLP